MKRLHWIDVAKGICILAVIIGHTKNDIVNKIVFSFHLTVFFILSGYTLKDNKLDREYVSNKFKRMMTPYFITCFCIMIMDIINLIVIKQNYKIYSISYILRIDLVRTFFASGVISNFGDINLGGMIGAIWFLPALFFALIISKIIIEKKEKHSERFIISTIIAIISIISAKFLWLPFSIQSSMLACPFIIFGKFVKEKEIIEKIKLKEAIGILAIFILGYMLNKTSIFFVEASMQDIVITPVIAILSSLLIMRISMIFEKSKTLRYIGENSLYFFCIHLFLLETSGYYIKNICSMLGWKQEFYITFIFHVIICFIVSAIINLFKRFFNKQKEKSKTSSNRNLTIDVLRSICIILMIIGHVSIDAGLRRFIFSFHMMAFMVLSGYLYKETDEIVLKRIWKEIKRLIIPLAVFSIIFIYINNFGIIEELKTLLLGMSLSRKILTNVKSIGQFYFVLLLFIVKMLYILVNHFVKTIEKKTGKPHNMIYIYIGIITYIGVLLGKNGYWLPWSLDIALYSLIFFHIGYLLKNMIY